MEKATQPVVELLEGRQLLSAATVNSTADTDVRDASLTLREAIEYVNGTLAASSLTPAELGQIDATQPLGTNNTINFDIPGTGVQTITLADNLPEIVKSVTIDGYTQPGASANTLTNGDNAKLQIELKGGGATVGLDFFGVARESAVRGLVINDMGNDAIVISETERVTVAGCFLGTDPTGTTAQGNIEADIEFIQTDANTIGGTTPADRNVIASSKHGILMNTGSGGDFIEGNYIGTNAAGTAALGNGIGIDVSAASGVTIGGTSAGAGNLIAGNSGDGVLIDSTNGDVTGEIVEGNLIGVDVTGAKALANGGAGIDISNDSDDTDDTVADPTSLINIGGTVAGARNIISGNGDDGITIDGDIVGTSSTVIQGNFIGTSQDGTTAIPNGGDGIFIVATRNPQTIGGAAPGAGNLISGNAFVGVSVARSDVTLQGNLIGTNAAQTAALPNGSGGISVFQSGLTAGGTGAGAGNVIAGNGGPGISVHESGSLIQGNFIGTTAAGLSLGNNGDGIVFTKGSGEVGGTIPQAGNVIAYNAMAGVLVSSPASSAEIRLNSIYANGGLGIDLSNPEEDDGVTGNDTGDGDTGANGLQNFPVLGSATSSNGSTTIQGAINTVANTPLVIDFYADAPNLPAQAEGKRYLGSQVVLTDANGNATFDATYPTAVAGGQFVTATATATSTDETSEFSQPVSVQTPAPPVAPTIFINDIRQNEGTGGSGTTGFTFTLTRSGDLSNSSIVSASTADGASPGGATAGSDYIAQSGTLVAFAPNQATATFTVNVNADITVESEETFLVNLTAVTNATIGDGQGLGTIQNDDVAPPITIKAPSGLSGSVTSDSAVSLKWKDNSSNETGFEIQYSKSSSFSSPATVPVPGANIKSANVSGLDANTKYYFRVRAVGPNNSASPYSSSINLTTKKAPAPAPAVTALELLDADTGHVLTMLTDGMTIHRSSYPGVKKFTIVALTAGSTESVRFGFQGKSSYRTENSTPYSLFGNSNGKFTGQTFANGAFAVIATPFTKDNAAGTAGSALTVHFTVVS